MDSHPGESIENLAGVSSIPTGEQKSTGFVHVQGKEPRKFLIPETNNN